MKTLSSFLILACLAGAIMLAISIPGCFNPIADSGKNPYQARTERDFVLNSNLRAAAGVIVAFDLEDYFSPEDTIPDTGTRGVDVIQVRYIENATHHLTLAPNSFFTARLEDQGSVTIFHLTPDDRAQTVNIPAGDYHLYITSYLSWYSDSSVSRQTIFMQPSQYETNPNGYGPRELNTTFTSGACVGCDLSKTLMINMYLGGANLYAANLSHSNLRLTDFTGANIYAANVSSCDMSFTNLYYAIFGYAYFKNTNLYGSNLQHTTLYASDLTNANMNNAYLNFGNLQHANLSYANLVGADLSGADFCFSTKTGLNAAGAIVSPETQCWP